MVVFDTNVVFEILQKRTRYKLASASVADERAAAITMATVANVMYLVEKEKVSWEKARAALSKFIWLPMLPEDGVWAFARFGGEDYEDALQVACAVREGCTRFVTLDAGLAKKYKSDIKIDLVR